MFPFKHIPYRQYNYSFLSVVSLRIDFKRNMEAIDSEESYALGLKDFLERFFTIRIEDVNALINHNVRIKDENQTIFINIERDFIEIEAKGEGYADFRTTITPLLDRLSSYFKNVANVESFEAISLRKENHWELTVENNEKFDFEKARKLILSTDFIESAQKILSQGNSQNYDYIFSLTDNISTTDHPVYLQIQNSAFESKEEPGTHVLSMTYILTLKDISICSYKDLMEILKEMNKLSFDTFHWSVSPGIIDLMKKPPFEEK